MLFCLNGEWSQLHDWEISFLHIVGCDLKIADFEIFAVSAFFASDTCDGKRLETVARKGGQSRQLLARGGNTVGNSLSERNTVGSSSSEKAGFSVNCHPKMGHDRQFVIRTELPIGNTSSEEDVVSAIRRPTRRHSRQFSSPTSFVQPRVPDINCRVSGLQLQLPSPEC